jgi:hypothetical protein
MEEEGKGLIGAFLLITILLLKALGIESWADAKFATKIMLKNKNIAFCIGCKREWL